MRFADIPVPDELLEALDSDSLVIFVGAGVSCPKPASIGNFRELAAKVGQDFGRSLGEKELPDQFLGKLAKDGCAVHKRTVKHVFGPHTAPTALHAHLVQVFGSGERVRLVTTNFDTHLSTAFETAYPTTPLSPYMAPAVPCGDDFLGLVYLHGSAVDPDVKHMVLTDADFGRAYITYGWAREFLIKLFSEYTVLFVGFSHEDVVMSYLAHGLDPNAIKKRYAFVCDTDDLSKWHHLGIEPIAYPKRSGAENEHEALTDIFGEWVAHSGMSFIERGKAVRDIVSRSPLTLSEQNSARLRFCLGEPRLVIEFCDSVNDVAWVTWLHESGELNGVFYSEDMSEAQYRLGKWLVSFLLMKNPRLLLKLLGNRHLAYSAKFCEILVYAVWSDRDKITDPVAVSCVIEFVLQRFPNCVGRSIWCYVLKELQFPQDEGVFLRVFDFLTTPSLEIKEPLRLTQDREFEVDEAFPEPEWDSEIAYWVNEVVPGVPKSLYPKIHQICIKQLVLACDIGSGRKFDSLNWKRSSIAPHPQNHSDIYGAFSALVDLARDTLDWMLIHDSDFAQVLVKQYWESSYNLIKRFSLWARADERLGPPEDRLEWLLEKQCLLIQEWKKEIFDFLYSTVSKVDPYLQKKVVDQIISGVPQSVTGGWEKKALEYEKFKMLSALQARDLENKILRSALDDIHNVYPHFGPREYPELNHWSVEGFENVGKYFDDEDILASQPSAYIEQIQSSYDTPSVHRPERMDYLSHLSKLFMANTEWGIRFTKEFLPQAGTPEEVSYVFHAWREASKTLSDWDGVLTLFENLPQSQEVLSGIAQALSFAQNNKHFPEQYYQRGFALISKAGQVCKEIQLASDGIEDLYGAAINDVGGCIAEYLVHYCSYCWNRKDEGEKQIPADALELITEMLSCSSRTAVLARIAMTPFIGYYFVWDLEFSKKHLLPLFDWEADSERAKQTWATYLLYRRENFTVIVEATRNYYFQTVQKLDRFANDVQERVGAYLLVYALSLVSN